VSARSVRCTVVGEHGPGQVLVWESVTVDGITCDLDVEQRTIVRDYVDNWYVRHVALDSGRTSTWSSGLGGALMIEAITLGGDSAFPVSVVLEGEYGVASVSSSTPVLLGPAGIREIIEIPLSPSDTETFRETARHIEALAALLPVAC